MERTIGASCINGVFLDELDPSRGHSVKPVVEDCGIMCEVMDLNRTSRPYVPKPTRRRKMARKTINKQIKALDGAARLAMGKKKKASLIATSEGLLCSTGLDVAAPNGVGLPPGVYVGEQLITVYDALKHAETVEIGHRQVGEGWQVLLFDPADAENAVALDWQSCVEPTLEIPPTSWKVDKEQIKMFRAMYTMAQVLKKSQLRLLCIRPHLGVMSYLSPTTVAQWWRQEWVDESAASGFLNIEIDDIKRAVLYKGGKLIAIGTSSGKINWAFDDGAFMRTDCYDGDGYSDQEIQRVFTYDPSSYVWELGTDQPMQALVEMIAAGSAESYSDGTYFYPDSGAEDNAAAMPLTCAPGVFTAKVINNLMAWADKVQISGVESDPKRRGMAFYGEGYRGVTSTTPEA